MQPAAASRRGSGLVQLKRSIVSSPSPPEAATSKVNSRHQKLKICARNGVTGLESVEWLCVAEEEWEGTCSGPARRVLCRAMTCHAGGTLVVLVVPWYWSGGKVDGRYSWDGVDWLEKSLVEALPDREGRGNICS